MKIFVKAKPGAKKESIEPLDGLFAKPGETHLRIAVKEPAVDGRANRAIEKVVAAYFKVAPSRVRLTNGQASRNKILEIGDA